MRRSRALATDAKHSVKTVQQVCSKWPLRVDKVAVSLCLAQQKEACRLRKEPVMRSHLSYLFPEISSIGQKLTYLVELSGAAEFGLKCIGISSL